MATDLASSPEYIKQEGRSTVLEDPFLSIAISSSSPSQWNDWPSDRNSRRTSPRDLYVGLKKSTNGRVSCSYIT